MAFWNENDPSTVTPKQSHRWVVYFSTGPTASELQPYFAKSIKKPSYEIQTETARLMYSYDVSFPKRLVWKPISIEFYDINNSNIDTERHFLKILKESGYSYGDYTKFTYKEELIKKLTKLTSSNKYYISLVELGEYGNKREEWKIYNPLITSVSPSNLNYESSDASTIPVEIEYDYAVLDITKPNSHSIESEEREIIRKYKVIRTDEEAKKSYYNNLKDFNE